MTDDLQCILFGHHPLSIIFIIVIIIIIVVAIIKAQTANPDWEVRMSKTHRFQQKRQPSKKNEDLENKKDKINRMNLIKLQL